MRIALAAYCLCLAGPARAEPCDAPAFRAAIAEGSARLQSLNAAEMSRVRARLQTLRASQGWSEAEAPVRIAALISDADTARHTAAAEAARLRITSADAAGDRACAALEQTRAALSQMQEAAQAKWTHIAGNIDRTLAPVEPGAPHPIQAAN